MVGLGLVGQTFCDRTCETVGWTDMRGKNVGGWVLCGRPPFGLVRKRRGEALFVFSPDFDLVVGVASYIKRIML